MAKTIEIEAYPNETTAYAVARTGGTGTPAASYAMTPVGGAGSWLYTITVAEELLGEWDFRAGDAYGNSGRRAVNLTASQDFYGAVNVPSAVEVRQEIDSNSTKLKVAAAGAAGSVAVTDNEDGTLTLSFKDTDGTTEVANTTYTTETGARTRNS